MGSKSQIALSDLEAKQAEPNGRRKKKPQRGVAAGKRRNSDRGDANAKVIPAFLSEPDDADAISETAGQPHDDAANANACNSGDDEIQSPRGNPESANQQTPPTDDTLLLDRVVEGDAHSADQPTCPQLGGPEPAGTITDPELIALLEQLSTTIDTANQVLSAPPQAPGPAAAQVTDEYLAAGTPQTPGLATPAASAGATHRTGQLAGLAFALVLVAAGGGALWWFKTNPWLLGGAHDRDTAMAVRSDRTITASLPARRGLPVPVPAVDIPLPVRKPDSTTELPPAQEVALQPPDDNEPVPIMQTGLSEPMAEERLQPERPRGVPGKPIPLGLSAPLKRDGLEVSVMVQGVPQGATLTAGSRISGGTWILEEGEIGNVALITPQSYAAGEVELEVAFVKSDGKIPDSRLITVVVEPAQPPVSPVTHGLAAVDAGKAPPVPVPALTAARGPAPGGTAAEQAPTADPAIVRSKMPKLSSEEEQRLLARADELLKLKDIASARLLLEHAARRGSTDAMLTLAKTFDPKQISALGLGNVQPDITQANAWYERASRGTGQ